MKVDYEEAYRSRRLMRAYHSCLCQAGRDQQDQKHSRGSYVSGRIDRLLNAQMGYAVDIHQVR